MRYIVGILILSFSLFACNSDYTVGKKKGYARIDFPEKKYQSFDAAGYPYSFEYPVYANVVKDSTYFNEKADDWWINIDIPRFNAKIHVSYKPINAKNNFDTLVRDGFKMAYQQHVNIASGIRDSALHTSNNVEGIYFSLEGNTATANQFFLTDTVHHFLRGALYFDSTPNADSLGVVNEYLKTDLLHLINTLKWRENKK
jgi:gliding motility-associated lipoprotein GldD